MAAAAEEVVVDHLKVMVDCFSIEVN